MGRCRDPSSREGQEMKHLGHLHLGLAYWPRLPQYRGFAVNVIERASKAARLCKLCDLSRQIRLEYKNASLVMADARLLGADSIGNLGLSHAELLSYVFDSVHAPIMERLHKLVNKKDGAAP